jgi:hypothetical protein
MSQVVAPLRLRTPPRIARALTHTPQRLALTPRVPATAS